MAFHEKLTPSCVTVCWSVSNTRADTSPSPHNIRSLDQLSRQHAYRELFRFELEPGLLDEIRRVTNGNFAPGDSCFAAQIEEAARGLRSAPGRPGQPCKRANQRPRFRVTRVSPLFIPGSEPASCECQYCPRSRRDKQR